MQVNKMKKVLIGIFYIMIFHFAKPVYCAEEIAFTSGIFSRKIVVEEIEMFAKTKKTEGFIKNLVGKDNKDIEDLSTLLNQEFDLSITVMSKLMNSQIGEVILKRASKIIYPLRIQDPKITIPAIRSSIIKGLVKGNGRINLLLFIKSYPNKTMVINVPELFEVIDKVESISELVKFFSNSPLEGLKEGTPKT